MTNSTTNKKKNKVIAIVGATASGKTSYAINLAKEIGGEVVSADSRLVYKGFDIACAKPTLEEQDGIPHYMMDIVEPEFDYSAGLYEQDAKRIVCNILSRGKTPIVAGGTGLYFRVLLENFDLPKVEGDFEYRKKMGEYDKTELFEMLKKQDPISAERIEQNDKKKIIRALEVLHLTGKPMSEIQGIKEPEFDVEWIGCNFPREVLYERINRRVDLMFENGIIEETQNLIKKHGRIGNIVDSIGYKEVLAYLDGVYTLEEAKDKLKQNSRNYAKRQLTWFRKNPNIKWTHYPEKLKK